MDGYRVYGGCRRIVIRRAKGAVNRNEGWRLVVSGQAEPAVEESVAMPTLLLAGWPSKSYASLY